MLGKLVQNLAKRGCITIDKRSSLFELADLLSTKRIGAVVIVDDNKKPIGIVSERDIVRHLHKSNKEFSEKNVSDIMSTKLITCGLSDSSSELMELMTKHKVRHIPIVNNGELIGMVTIGDVVNRLIEIYETETEHLKKYINS